MKLRNVLIVVKDMDRSIQFYQELFELNVIQNQEGTVMMTEGLVLQDAEVWKGCLNKDLLPKNHMTELYFEEADFDGFMKKLEESEFEIEYVNEVVTFDWGQKMIRIYDLDGNLIEVRSPFRM